MRRSESIISRRRMQHRNRRGVAVIVVLVCMVIAAAVFTIMLRQIGLSRRVVDEAQRQHQAAWLVESGIERAAARLADDPQYKGETWKLSAEEIGDVSAEGQRAGLVVVEVEPVPDEPNRRIVRVRADWPDHPHDRCRREKQVTVELTKTP